MRQSKSIQTEPSGFILGGKVFKGADYFFIGCV